MSETKTQNFLWKEIQRVATSSPIQKAEFNRDGTSFVTLAYAPGSPGEITIYKYSGGEFKSQVLAGEYVDFELSKNRDTLVSLTVGDGSNRLVQVHMFDETTTTQKGQTFTFATTSDSTSSPRIIYPSISGNGNTVAIGEINGVISRFINVYNYDASGETFVQVGAQVSVITEYADRFAFIPYLNDIGDVLYAGCNVLNGTNYLIAVAKFALVGGSWTQEGPTFLPVWDDDTGASNEPTLSINDTGSKAIVTNGRHNIMYETTVVDSVVSWVVGEDRLSTGNNEYATGIDLNFNRLLLNNIIQTAADGSVVDDSLLDTFRYVEMVETRTGSRLAIALDSGDANLHVILAKVKPLRPPTIGPNRWFECSAGKLY